MNWVTLPESGSTVSDIFINVNIPVEEQANNCTVVLTVSDNDDYQETTKTLKIDLELKATALNDTANSGDSTFDAHQARIFNITGNSPITTKSEMTRSGQAKISFDKYVLVPTTLYNLTSENEGPEFFEVTLKVNDLNKQAFQDYQPELQGRRLKGDGLYDFKWFIVKSEALDNFNFDF